MRDLPMNEQPLSPIEAALEAARRAGVGYRAESPATIFPQTVQPIEAELKVVENENPPLNIETFIAPSSLATPAIRPYLITRTNNEILGAVDRLRLTGFPVNVLVTGDHGTGKSELAQQFAATRNLPFAQLDCGGLTEAFQIFGKMTLVNDHTVYQPGLFTEALRTPNCVIHLQELNRAESDRALNALFSLLDDTSRSLWVEEMGERIEVAPGVVFFATLNEGFQYIGTMPLDEALKDRFLVKLRLEKLPREHEEQLLVAKCGLSNESAMELISTVEQIRDQGRVDSSVYISTRDLIQMGTLVRVGVSAQLALFTVLGTSVDNLESILLGQHFSGNSTMTNVFSKEVEPLK
jgi:nitric oxide reductase NorQ protein